MMDRDPAVPAAGDGSSDPTGTASDGGAGVLASRPAPSKKYKPPKKRVKGVPSETYRDRWLKRMPRKNMASWVAGVCGACECGARAGELIACGGPCMRSFHLSCVGFDDEDAPALSGGLDPERPWFCPECDTGRLRCFVCGEFGTSAVDLDLRKCSLGACGRFYHVTCASKLPLCNMGASGSFFRCPQHYCAACGKSGDGVDMVKCLRCPVAYHTPSCTPSTVKRVPGCPKGILCTHCAGSPASPYQAPPPLTDAERRQLLRWQLQSQASRARQPPAAHPAPAAQQEPWSRRASRDDGALEPDSKRARAGDAAPAEALLQQLLHQVLANTSLVAALQAAASGSQAVAPISNGMPALPLPAPPPQVPLPQLPAALTQQPIPEARWLEEAAMLRALEAASARLSANVAAPPPAAAAPLPAALSMLAGWSDSIDHQAMWGPTASGAAAPYPGRGLHLGGAARLAAASTALSFQPQSQPQPLMQPQQLLQPLMQPQQQLQPLMQPQLQPPMQAQPHLQQQPQMQAQVPGGGHPIFGSGAAAESLLQQVAQGTSQAFACGSGNGSGSGALAAALAAAIAAAPAPPPPTLPTMAGSSSGLARRGTAPLSRASSDVLHAAGSMPQLAAMASPPPNAGPPMQHADLLAAAAAVPPGVARAATALLSSAARDASGLGPALLSALLRQLAPQAG